MFGFCWVKTNNIIYVKYPVILYNLNKFDGVSERKKSPTGFIVLDSPEVFPSYWFRDELGWII